jgi:phosphoribosylamine--glycine ligase
VVNSNTEQNTIMNVLIVGGGGREHALAWKARHSADVQQVYVAPGNAGTALESGITNVDCRADDIEGLIRFAKESDIHLTIVGPEGPLVSGIVDQFQAQGLRIFGPTAAAAQLEGSKAFCKDFLIRHSIPTAAYQTFTEVAPAKAYINQCNIPLVIKADGLAAGKGVVIAHSTDEAMAAVDDMLSANRFGDAGSKVVIEEFLHGEELSFICMVDGKNVLPMATSQDHKARDNGDLGPNTGGMGAYSPASGITDDMHDRIVREIIEPTVNGIHSDGNTFTGFLYAGLMIDNRGNAKVLEYNVRFGDPETQPIMMRLQSDLVQLCDAALDNRLDQCEAIWSPMTALGVVMAAGGYPDSPKLGDSINGLDRMNNADETTVVFHAGTSLEGDRIVTSGGRVICVTALGDSVAEAQSNAYKAADNITWQGCFYRTDIGYRAINREQSNS